MARQWDKRSSRNLPLLRPGRCHGFLLRSFELRMELVVVDGVVFEPAISPWECRLDEALAGAR